MDHAYAASIVAVPTVIGLVNAAKSAGLPSRFAPLAAIIAGVLLQIFQVYMGSMPGFDAALVGAGLGLSAVGLHAGTRATIAPKPAKKRAIKLPLPKVPVTRVVATPVADTTITPDGTPGAPAA